MNKKHYYDKESDSLFIYVKEGEEDSFEEVAPGVNLEMNEKGDIIGVEILQASRFLQDVEKSGLNG